jgi:hypothetical protein
MWMHAEMACMYVTTGKLFKNLIHTSEQVTASETDFNTAVEVKMKVLSLFRLNCIHIFKNIIV